MIKQPTATTEETASLIALLCGNADSRLVAIEMLLLGTVVLDAETITALYCFANSDLQQVLFALLPAKAKVQIVRQGAANGFVQLSNTGLLPFIFSNTAEILEETIDMKPFRSSMEATNKALAAGAIETKTISEMKALKPCFKQLKELTK